MGQPDGPGCSQGGLRSTQGSGSGGKGRHQSPQPSCVVYGHRDGFGDSTTER